MKIFINTLLVLALLLNSCQSKVDNKEADAVKDSLRMEKEIKQVAAPMIAKQMAAYRFFQTQWKELKTEKEKELFMLGKWKEFEQFGVNVITVSQAQAFLIDDAEKVEADIERRCKSKAAYQLAEDRFRQAKELEALQ